MNLPLFFHSCSSIFTINATNWSFFSHISTFSLNQYSSSFLSSILIHSDPKKNGGSKFHGGFCPSFSRTRSRATWRLWRGNPRGPRHLPESRCQWGIQMNPNLVGGLVASFYFPINIGLLSSSQLTNSIIFQDGVFPKNHQPAMIKWAKMGCMPEIGSTEREHVSNSLAHSATIRTSSVETPLLFVPKGEQSCVSPPPRSWHSRTGHDWLMWLWWSSQSEACDFLWRCFLDISRRTYEKPHDIVCLKIENTGRPE